MATISIISGGTTGDILTTDITSKALRVTPYDKDGHLLPAVENSTISNDVDLVQVGGLNDKAIRELRMDRVGTIKPGFDSVLFRYDNEGATVNTQVWTQSLSVFTQAQTAATGVRMNSAAGVAANSSSILTSQKQFWKGFHNVLRARMRIRVDWRPNFVADFGFGTVTGNSPTIPTGAYIRYSNEGTVRPVLAFNGMEVAAGYDISNLLDNNNYYTWSIIVDDDAVTFTCQNSSNGNMINEQVLVLGLTQTKTFSVTHLPVFARLCTTAVAGFTAGDMFVGQVQVVNLDLNQSKPWSHQMVTLGNSAEVHPTTYAQTAQWANSATPTALASGTTLVNTAAGYTTLGGLFAYNAVANTTTPTDYPLFAFTVPAPFSFYCTRVTASFWNTGAPNSGTVPTTLTWSLLGNSTTANLTTAVGGFLSVGTTTLPVSSAVGAASNVVTQPFETPVRTDPGRILIVVMNLTSGATTASQVLMGMVTISGYYE